MAIELIDCNPKRELARKLFDATLSDIPIAGSKLAAIYSVTHRSHSEVLLDKWRNDITAAFNALEECVSELVPTITLSDDAASLGKWFSLNSEHGNRASFEFGTIINAFPDATKLELEDACGELELDRLVRCGGGLGVKIVDVNLQTLLYEVFDPIAFESAIPRGDAAELARYVLLQNGTVSAEKAMSHFDWNIRRFNPAMAIICEFIGDGRKSSELHPELVCRYVMPSSSERVQMRRFADQVLGAEGKN